MKNKSKLRSGLAINIIGSIVLLLVIFSIIVSIIGSVVFTDAIKNEYSVTTYHIADTATTLVNGDHIKSYLDNGEDAEYLSSKRYLDVYCLKMKVSLIYVIAVDTSDYGRFVSVFNSVDNSVDDTNYSPWELGHKRDTTNDEYREKYRALYEGEKPYETVYRTTNLKGQHPHITTLVPVKDSQDRTAAILCVQRPMSELKSVRRPFVIKIAVSALIVSIAAALIAALFIRRNLVNPIRRVSNEATRFASENTEGEKLDRVSKINEISLLADSINKMESDMLRYIDNLTSATAERERLDAELSVAATIQSNSIPNVFPAFPDRDDFDIFASMTPAKEVGGDFYNFFITDRDRLVFVIGDVSGKGVPAALFMMVTNILITDRAKMGGTPAEILSYVNDNICEHNKTEMFVTLWLGILDLPTGRLTASSAGHDDALICRSGGEFERFKTVHGLMAGVMPGLKYKDNEIRLGKGDKLFIYTDGVTEASDSGNRLFSLERTVDALNESREGSPSGILENVRKRIDEFVGAAPQFDDLTMLCVEYMKNNNEKKITVDAAVEELAAVTEFVESVVSEHGCSVKEMLKITLSVEEIFVNIANYAYDGKTGSAEISADVTDGLLTVEFRDRGKPFDPIAKPDPDTSLEVEKRAIGGLGIFLVKKNMDSVSYERRDGCNILTLTKKL